MSTEICNNGGCTSPVFRGKECIYCWAGTKFDSMKSRIANRNGKTKSYVGIPLEFTRRELISWVLSFPPPDTIKNPSIDRIDPKKGYVPGNIRWLEFRVNCKGPQRDIPEGLKRCPKCFQILPLNTTHFHADNSRKGFQSQCKKCRSRRKEKHGHSCKH